MTDILEDATQQIGEPEPEPVPEPEPQPLEPADVFEFDGRQIPKEQLQTTIRFMDWAQQNPQAWDELIEWEQGRRVLVPAEEWEEPQTEEPVEEGGYLDEEWEDPRYQQMRAEMEEMRQALGQVGQTAHWREEMARREAMTAGIQAFAGDHQDLGEDDWNRLFLSARDHQLIATYIARDPYNPVEAVRRALDAAYKIEFYGRAHEGGARDMVNDLEARRRAAAASSSKTSVPRAQPEEVGTLQAITRDAKAMLDAQEG